MVHQAVRNKRQGKAVQSKLAKRLGGENVGTLGGEDIRLPNISLEAKHCKAFVGNKFLEQAEKNAPIGKTPVVAVHAKGQRFTQSIVLMRLTVWEEWMERINHYNCMTCAHGDEGICMECDGDNYGHATEISNRGWCKNWRKE